MYKVLIHYLVGGYCEKHCAPWHLYSIIMPLKKLFTIKVMAAFNLYMFFLFTILLGVNVFTVNLRE